MGDGFIVRRGGSAGLSKCSIVVNIDTGSTVAAYSNAAATTLVKTGKEIGTSGNYIITGLNTGTDYYIKATKGSNSRISSAVRFSAFGIKVVSMAYEFVIFRNGAFVDTNLGGFKTISSGSNPSVAAPSWGISGGNLFVSQNTGISSSAYPSANGVLGFNNPFQKGSFSTLHFKANKGSSNVRSASGTFGISATNSATYLESIDLTDTLTEYTIDLTQFSQTSFYIVDSFSVSAPHNVSGYVSISISEIWLT